MPTKRRIFKKTNNNIHEKSVYETITKKKNPAFMDKHINYSGGSMIKVTKNLIDNIRKSPAGKLPSSFKKYLGK